MVIIIVIKQPRALFYRCHYYTQSVAELAFCSPIETASQQKGSHVIARINKQPMICEVQLA